jgi:hypothetical protein
MLAPTVGEVSTVGGSAVTVTASVTPASAITTSTTATCPSGTSMLFFTVAIPLISNETV